MNMIVKDLTVVLCDAKGQKKQEIQSYQLSNAPDMTTPGSTFSKTLLFDYYANGMKKNFTYPQFGGAGTSTTGDGGTISYTCDSNAQLRTVTLPNGQAISYDNYNWTVPTQKTMPGTITTMGYDALLRPTRIKSQAINALNAAGQVTTIGSNQAPAGNVLMDYRYSFNEVGNIGKRQTEHGDYQYAYDDLDRLTQAIPPGNTTLPTNPNQPNYTALPNEVYSYDAVHNRKTSTHQPGTWIVNANNQLTQWGDPAGSNANQPKVTQTFDDNGHLKSKTVLPENQNDPENANRQIGYNTAERMNSVKDGSGNEIAKYAYDPFGRRIRKIATIGEQAGTTTFIYGANGLIAEADQTGNITTTYGWLPNGAWGTSPLYKADIPLTGGSSSNQSVHYYHTDHLGTSQRLTNEAGMVTWEGRMEAFGKTTALLTTLGSTTTNRLRFPGQYEDSETATYYNYFRDYQACTGRYGQSDPIGMLGGINRYGYVGADPVRNADNFGLQKRQPRPQPPNVPACDMARVPAFPPGANIFDNIDESRGMSGTQWYDSVRNRGRWDYKYQDSNRARYEAFGNFNYGATAYGLGIPLNGALRGAGWAAGKAGTKDPNSDWYGGPPYGDDPKDQVNIENGFKFAEDYASRVCGR